MVGTCWVDAVFVWDNLPELHATEGGENMAGKRDDKTQTCKVKKKKKLSEVLTLAPIWLPHWPACRWTISRIFRCKEEPDIRDRKVPAFPQQRCERTEGGGVKDAPFECGWRATVATPTHGCYVVVMQQTHLIGYLNLRHQLGLFLDSTRFVGARRLIHVSVNGGWV